MLLLLAAATQSSLPNASSPFLAMGMVTAPFAEARRSQVRQTMLRYDTVVRGRTVFRFVVGDTMPLLGSDASAEQTRRSSTR